MTATVSVGEVAVCCVCDANVESASITGKPHQVALSKSRCQSLLYFSWISGSLFRRRLSNCCHERCKNNLVTRKLFSKETKSRKNLQMKQWLTLTPGHVTSAPWCSLKCPAIGKRVLANPMCELSYPLPPQGICTFLILSPMIHARARSTCV